MTRCAGPLLLSLLWGVAAAAGPARADADPPPASEPAPTTPEAPGVYVTGSWLLLNLIPGPEIVIGEPGVAFGLGWQVTPLLLSLRMQPGLSPWRVLVAEPLVRHSGSLEWYLQPDLVFRGRSFGDSWLLGSGLRGYLPVLHNGEYLSLSLAAGYVAARERSASGLAWTHSPAVELGVYVLFGSLGLRLRVTPLCDESVGLVTFKLSFF